jgi:hypothetical protein
VAGSTLLLSICPVFCLIYSTITLQRELAAALRYHIPDTYFPLVASR